MSFFCPSPVCLCVVQGRVRVRGAWWVRGPVIPRATGQQAAYGGHHREQDLKATLTSYCPSHWPWSELHLQWLSLFLSLYSFTPLFSCSTLSFSRFEPFNSRLSSPLFPYFPSPAFLFSPASLQTNVPKEILTGNSRLAKTNASCLFVAQQ